MGAVHNAAELAGVDEEHVAAAIAELAVGVAVRDLAKTKAKRPARFPSRFMMCLLL